MEGAVKIKVCLLFALAFVSVQAHATAIDCSSPKDRIEQLICASPRVSALDNQLALLFDKVESETRGVDGETGKVIDSFGNEHRRWIRRVRNHCSSEKCLLHAYRARITQVKRQWKDSL
jgi:uncharacterized protein